MNVTLPPPTELRPDADSMNAVRQSCHPLLDRQDDFRVKFSATLADLLVADHPLNPAGSTLGLELAEAVVRAVLSEPDLVVVETQWQQLGGRLAALGMPDDGYAAIARALVRAVRDLCGDAWSSPLSSDWACVHLWLVGHLTAGAGRARSAIGFRSPFPQLAPPVAPRPRPEPEPEPAPARTRSNGTARGRRRATAAHWLTADTAPEAAGEDLQDALNDLLRRQLGP